MAIPKSRGYRGTPGSLCHAKERVRPLFARSGGQHFGQRIMFGSDFPDQVAPGIDAIPSADFLIAEQKADILCRNAARFLRLGVSTCQP